MDTRRSTQHQLTSVKHVRNAHIAVPTGDHLSSSYASHYRRRADVLFLVSCRAFLCLSELRHRTVGYLFFPRFSMLFSVSVASSASIACPCAPPARRKCCCNQQNTPHRHGVKMQRVAADRAHSSLFPSPETIQSVSASAATGV